MEFNNNIYIVISTQYVEDITNHRLNNDGTKIIVEYGSLEEIPSEIQGLALSVNTHQQILQIVQGDEWNRSTI